MEGDLFKHDSHAPFFRTPFGAVSCGEKITLRFKVKSRQADPNAGNPDKRVFLLLVEELSGKIRQEELAMHVEEKMKGELIFCKEILAPASGFTVVLFHYPGDDSTRYYGNSPQNTGGIRQNL